MRITYRYLLLLIVLSGVLTGCKKDKIPGPPVAKFTFSTNPANAGDTVSFINNSSNASNYSWGFGDAFYSTEKNPTHTYTYAGTYTVVLKAIGNGDTNQVSKSLKIVIPQNIFEGKGIKYASLGETWIQIDSTYHKDPITNYGIEYDKVNNVYDFLIYYVDKGVLFDFLSNGQLGNNDPVIAIYVVAPYIGMTEKGVKLQDKMSDVISTYGTPDQQTSSSNYLGYYYMSDGIYFESDTYPFTNVEAIVIFKTSGGSASKNGQANGIATKQLKHLLTLCPFLNMRKSDVTK